MKVAVVTRGVVRFAFGLRGDVGEMGMLDLAGAAKKNS